METLREKWMYWLIKPLSMLPLGVLYVISDLLIYPLVYYIFGYRRRVVRNNLVGSFPELPNVDVKHIEKRFYRHFCGSFMETIRILSMSEAEATARMRCINVDVVTNYTSNGRGVLLLLGHYGNWEYQMFSFLQLAKTGNQQGYCVYRPLKNKAFDYLYRRIRTRFHSRIVTKEGTFRTVVQLRRDGIAGAFGLISDQTPSKSNIHYWTPFLNRDTPILTGPERMARQTGFAVVYADVMKIRRGYYQTTYSVLSDNPGAEPEFAMTERYARAMENTILRDPAYWLWTHKRWKHKRTPTPTNATP